MLNRIVDEAHSRGLLRRDAGRGRREGARAWPQLRLDLHGPRRRTRLVLRAGARRLDGGLLRRRARDARGKSGGRRGRDVRPVPSVRQGRLRAPTRRQARGRQVPRRPDCVKAGRQGEGGRVQRVQEDARCSPRASTYGSGRRSTSRSGRPSGSASCRASASSVFGQASVSEKSTRCFRVCARNVFGFGHGRAASLPTCRA